MVELTFAMVKPEAVQRGLVGKIITRFEDKYFKLLALKVVNVSQKQGSDLYKQHQGKPFYDNLLEYVQSGPVVVMVLERENAVEMVRKMIGNTDPLKADPGTIRGDFGHSIDHNVIHAADSSENADREIKIFFMPEEIIITTS